MIDCSSFNGRSWAQSYALHPEYIHHSRKDKNKGRENITFVTETTKRRGADRKGAGAIWREESSGGNHKVICKLDLSKQDY